MKGNKTRKLSGAPNERHEFTRYETSGDCNCEAIIYALGPDWWDEVGTDYNGHHGDCVATNHDPIPPRRSVEHVVTLGLQCVRCKQRARYVQFWEQRVDRYQKRGAFPLCDEHRLTEACGKNDRMRFLYRPGEDQRFDTWIEMSLILLQRMIVSCIVE